MKEATRENLATIRIVYCAPHTLALYGIPYEMRADVGQAPRHLWECAHDRPRAMDPRFDPLADWIPLSERDPLVRVWLARLKERDGLPGWPHEWVTLAGPMEAPADIGHAGGPTLPYGPGECVGGYVESMTDACDLGGD